ncbi:MAG: hypothetical protein SFV54_28030 [Bryobacteraceae bacterium]|nr:hypothetical protein [Bryobacteraceae bacterium]
MSLCHQSFRASLLAGALAVAGFAQESQPPAGEAKGWQKADSGPAYLLSAGTRVPLGLINSISTRTAAEGDRVYLETVFPIMSGGKIVIPPGSWVTGTVTQSKRAGRIKGRAELYVRFDSLILPNGVTRDFRARVGAVDGRGTEELDREEGRIRGEGTKGQDAMVVATTTATGASIGGLAGAVGGRPGLGVGAGALGGAAAGLVGVLVSRGSDAALPKGTTVEMVLDRELAFSPEELDFSQSVPNRSGLSNGPGPAQRQPRQGLGMPGRRFPLL